MLLPHLIAVLLLANGTEPVARSVGAIVCAYVDATRLADPDGEIALDDFQFYLPQIRQITAEVAGVQIVVTERGRIPVPHARWLVSRMRVPLGFILYVPGKPPKVLTGVQTDADFRALAVEYFGDRRAN